MLRSEPVVMEIHNSTFIWVKYEVRLFLAEEKVDLADLFDNEEWLYSLEKYTWASVCPG